MRMTSNLRFTRWLAAALVAVGACMVLAAEPPGTAVAAATGVVVTVAEPGAASTAVTVSAPLAEAVPAGTAAVAVVETVSTSAVVTVIATGTVAVAVPSGTGTVVSAEPETIAMPGFGAPVESQERISIALDDVPLQDVVRMFTRISGANIIATSTNLAGKVTVNLQDVEWKPALGAILDMYSLQITEKTPSSGIYSVIPKAPGAEDPLMASTIFLNYASVSNVAALVQPLLGRGGSVAPFPNCNALVIRASAANANEIRKVITEIDLPRKQVYIEAKFLELDDGAIKDLGIDWQGMKGYSVGVTPSWQLSDGRQKTKGNANSLDQTETRSRLDTVNQNPGASSQRTVVDTLNPSALTEQKLQNDYTRQLSDIRGAILDPVKFTAILSALKSQSGASIISNPKIIVANEQTATIHIGLNEPNIKGTVTAGQQGQANTTTYELDPVKPYFEFGVKLDVTPVINNSSNITVSINPTLSRPGADKMAPDGTTFPRETTKTITTTFSLASGKTAAIGGLTQTDDQKGETKIPLLGDIPIIGKYLFTYNHSSRAQSETIIFVTVGVVDAQTIDRAEGLPEDAELVHRHMMNLRRGAGGVPGTGSVSNATLTAPMAKQ